jgi:hypothetical protein
LIRWALGGDVTIFVHSAVPNTLYYYRVLAVNQDGDLYRRTCCHSLSTQ